MRHREWHRTERISWLRAAVLGALPPVSSLPTAGALRQNILLSGAEAWLPVRSRWRSNGNPQVYTINWTTISESVAYWVSQ